MNIDEIKMVVQAVRSAEDRMKGFESEFEDWPDVLLSLMILTYLDGYQDAKDDSKSSD